MSSLKIALVADELTSACLAAECRVMNVTPRNSSFVLRLWRPDVLFVESSWNGHRERWKYKIAAYPDYPERNNNALRQLVEAARSRGVPTVFWNREDGVHFDRFIGSAKLFDSIFTVDEAMIPRYRAAVGPDVPVQVMMFAAQPRFHSPAPAESVRRASFVGSYNSEIHPERRRWQDMMFDAADAIGLTVFDRNSGRRNPKYRVPRKPWMEVREAIAHRATAEVYRSYVANLNINTIETSPTAFSRRLVEILACGGLAVTNPTPAVERLFADYCAIVRSEEETRDLLGRLARDGLSRQQREMTRAAADYVLRTLTWRHCLEQIASVRA
jgi:spore maturation protein CgeB